MSLDFSRILSLSAFAVAFLFATTSVGVVGPAALVKSVSTHSVTPEVMVKADLKAGRLHVNRDKGGQESVHPLHGSELRALRPLKNGSEYVFLTEAGTPTTTTWFLRMIQRTGVVAAGLPFSVHPHMLRHSCGFKLANDGQDTRNLAQYLGHRNLQSTARYTALAPGRFKDFWSD